MKKRHLLIIGAGTNILIFLRYKRSSAVERVWEKPLSARLRGHPGRSRVDGPHLPVSLPRCCHGDGGGGQHGAGCGEGAAPHPSGAGEPAEACGSGGGRAGAGV